VASERQIAHYTALAEMASGPEHIVSGIARYLAEIGLGTTYFPRNAEMPAVLRPALAQAIADMDGEPERVDDYAEMLAYEFGWAS
jgi:hypothetical protein